MENKNFKVIAGFLKNYDVLKEKYSIKMARFANMLKTSNKEEKAALEEGIEEIKALMVNLDGERKILTASDKSVWECPECGEADVIESSPTSRVCNNCGYEDNFGTELVCLRASEESEEHMKHRIHEQAETPEEEMHEQGKEGTGYCEKSPLAVGDKVEIDADETEWHGMKGKIILDDDFTGSIGEHFEVELENGEITHFQAGELKKISAYAPRGSGDRSIPKVRFNLPLKDGTKVIYQGTEGVINGHFTLTEDFLHGEGCCGEYDAKDIEPHIGEDAYWIEDGNDDIWVLRHQFELINDKKKASLNKQAMQLQDVYFEEIDGELKEVTLEDLFGQYQAGQEGIKGNEIPEDETDEGFQDWLKERIDNEVTMLKKEASLDKQATIPEYEYAGKDGVISDMTEEEMRLVYEDEMEKEGEEATLEGFEDWISAEIENGHLEKKASLNKQSFKGNDKLPGGEADNDPESAFNPEALAKGTKDEMEHTNNKGIAKEIASDRLKSDPNHYDKQEMLDKGDYESLKKEMKKDASIILDWKAGSILQDKNGSKYEVQNDSNTGNANGQGFDILKLDTGEEIFIGSENEYMIEDLGLKKIK